MWVYLFLLGVLSTGVLTELVPIKEKQQRRLVVFIILYIGLFAGLRYNTGGDFVQYKGMFEKGIVKGNIYGWETGYFWLNNFFKFVFGNFVFLQLFVSLLFVIVSYRFYKENTSVPMFVFTIFVTLTLYNYLFALIRQSIAVVIVFVAARYVFKREFVKFVLMICFASFFHNSALLALPLYFIYVSWGRVMPIVLVVLFHAIYIYPDLVPNIVSVVAPYMPGRIEEIASDYLSNKAFSSPVQFGSGLYYLARILLTVVIVLLFTSKDRTRSFYINALVVAVLIRILSNNMNIIERTQIYYLMFGIVSFSYFVTDFQINRINRKVVQTVMTLLLLVFFFIPYYRHLSSKEINPLTHRTEYYRYVPYYNYINHPKEADKRKDWFQ